MQENRPFYRQEGVDGIGVLFDGGCGFELRKLKQEGGKDCPCLRILPLKHKQEVGKIQDDNEIIHDAYFIELAFGSAKSVDSLIYALERVKSKCFKEE